MTKPNSTRHRYQPKRYTSISFRLRRSSKLSIAAMAVAEGISFQQKLAALLALELKV